MLALNYLLYFFNTRTSHSVKCTTTLVGAAAGRWALGGVRVGGRVHNAFLEMFARQRNIKSCTRTRDATQIA